jgi:hypothetical protein
MVGILNALIGSYVPISTAFDSIATSTPTGTNTVTFSSIPGTYKHLQIRFRAANPNFDTLGVRFNGDTGTNYTEHLIEGSGIGTAGGGGNGLGVVSRIGILSLTDVANQQSVGVIEIIDYASTTKTKSLRYAAGRENQATSGRTVLGSGMRNNTEAITSVTLFAPGNFTTGTTFALYGIKG